MGSDELKPCPFCGGEARATNFVLEASAACYACKANITREHGRYDDSGLPEAITAWNTRTPDLAAEVLRLRAEVERLTEAITLIERCYYMEGKNAGWRAAHMDGIARDAQNGDDVAWARRLFPRDNQHLQDARAALKAKGTE